MAATNGNRGGKRKVLGARFSDAEVAEFEGKFAGSPLSHSQAIRMAILNWPGLPPRDDEIGRTKRPQV